MKPLRKTLEEIGLKPKEASIYLALIELGRATVNEIAKRSEINRTTIYPVIDEMIGKKLIFKTQGKGIQKFYAQDPEKILSEKRSGVDKFEQNMALFKALQKRTGTNPAVKLFEGEDAYEHFFNESLVLPMNSEILSFSATLNLEKFMPREFFDEYTRKRSARNILVRTIASNSPIARKLVDSAPQDLRSIRVVPAFFNFAVDMIIYGNKIATLSYEDNFSVMVIENDKIAQMMKASFELMWEGARMYEKNLPYYIYPNEIIL